MKTCKNYGGWTIVPFALVIIGALNWGLVGVGMFLDVNLNVVNLLVGQWSWLEAVVYILVGLSAVVGLFGSRCETCNGDSPSPAPQAEPASPSQSAEEESDIPTM